MAEYQMREPMLPDQRMRYPRMKLQGQRDLDRIARQISEGNTFTQGDIVGIVKALALHIAQEMGRGYSVKIEGLGVFTPRLGLRKDAEPEMEGGTKRNARSICVSGVNFRADKELVRETDRYCDLVRSATKPRRSSTRYTPEQRLRIAQEYLEQYPILTVTGYEVRTGLLHDAAAKELRKWADMPDSGIGRSGSGSHRVYIKKERV